MKSSDSHSDEKAPLAVGPFMREQIVSRLREALHIARHDLGAKIDRFRDLLADVVARADGIELVRAARGNDLSGQPSSRLRCVALAQTGGEVAGEFLLIPFGEVIVERPVSGESFNFTRAQAESACRWFAQLGRKLAIDYEHQSFDRLNTRPDGLRPAAGWIGGLEIRADGLWATNVTWTPRAQELLRSGEYRYFSPVIYWTDEDHTDVAALGPVALTNDPAMRGVRPLAARRLASEEPGEQASDGQAGEEQDGNVLIGGGDGPELGTEAELAAARTEVSLLRQRLAEQEADGFVERGLRLGKIVESTRADWRADYLRDPQAARQRLARAPVLLPPGRMIALDRRGEVDRWPVVRAGARAASPSLGPWVVEAEDLAAYERAAAVGRVLGLS